MKTLTLRIQEDLRRNTRLRRKQQDFRRRVHLTNRYCQLHTVHLGHQHVAEQMVWLEPSSFLNRLPSVVRHCYFKACILKNFAKSVRDNPLIVHDKYSGALAPRIR